VRWLWTEKHEKELLSRSELIKACRARRRRRRGRRRRNIAGTFY
jgi:hypothetical protein